MKYNLASRFLSTILCVLMVVPAWAKSSLKPGDILTIDCVNGNLLTKKETKATGLQTVAARVTLSLDSTATVLTVNVLNTATATDAVLYALDLGLPDKFVTVNRMTATFGGFPTGVRWQGPTDSAGLTNGIGNSIFAAREVIAGRMDDYLNRQTKLSAGFLGIGQGGNITVKFILAAEAKNKPLQIDPVAYFLMNDPNAPSKRIQIASTGVEKVK